MTTTQITNGDVDDLSQRLFSLAQARKFDNGLQGQSLAAILGLTEPDVFFESVACHYAADRIHASPNIASDQLLDGAQKDSDNLLYNIAMRSIMSKPSGERTLGDVLLLTNLGTGYHDALIDYTVFRKSMGEPVEDEDMFVLEGAIEAACVLDEAQYKVLEVYRTIKIPHFIMAVYRPEYVLRKALAELGKEEPTIRDQLTMFRTLHAADFVAGEHCIGVSRQSLNTDIELLQEYACVASTLNDLDSEVGQRASGVMNQLPLSHTGEDRLRLIRNYADIVTTCVQEGEAYASRQQAMLDPTNVEMLVRHLSNQEWVSAVTHPVGGVAMPGSADLFVSPGFCDQTEEAMGGAIQSYGYFPRELALIESSAKKLIQTLSIDLGELTQINLTDLGVGPEKFNPILKTVMNEGYSLANINLVDAENRRIQEARDKVPSTPHGQRNINEVHASFADLAGYSFNNPELPSVVCYLGNTFHNHNPDVNFDFLRNTDSEYAIIGIYQLPDDPSSHNKIIEAYSTPAQRKYAATAARIDGVSQKDLDSKCDYKVELMSEDMANGTRFQLGEGFEDVKVAVGYFEAKEEIKTPVVTYRQGDKIIGQQSIRFTKEQFELLTQRNNFEILDEVNDNEISLYLLKAA
jgi:hypothetical protein